MFDEGGDDIRCENKWIIRALGNHYNSCIDCGNFGKLCVVMIIVVIGFHQ